ncbi:MAG: flagellar hook assembly protein FlgD [Thermodesulfobacteriota bacterium]
MISPTYTGQVYDPATATTKKTGVESGMGQEAFLKMFMAQMTNQNPLDPMDNTQFTAQLAQFSSLEQLTKISKSLEGLDALQKAYQDTQALSYIGREVSMEGNLMPVTAGQAGSTTFTLASDAYVKVLVTNENGVTVLDQDMGRMAAGEQTFIWDGTTSYGQAAPDGAYRVSILATDTSGSAVKVSGQTVTGLVTGFQKDSAGVGYLLLGKTALPISAVKSVRLPVQIASEESTTNTGTGASGESSTLDGILQGLVNLGSLAAGLL